MDYAFKLVECVRIKSLNGANEAFLQMIKAKVDAAMIREQKSLLEDDANPRIVKSTDGKFSVVVSGKTQGTYDTYKQAQAHLKQGNDPNKGDAGDYPSYDPKFHGTGI